LRRLHMRGVHSSRPDTEALVAELKDMGLRQLKALETMAEAAKRIAAILDAPKRPFKTPKARRKPKEARNQAYEAMRPHWISKADWSHKQKKPQEARQ
jgi:hypothetical protein